MEVGEMGMWGGIYAIPMGIVCCLFIVPLWKAGKLEKKWIYTAFEFCWFMNFVYMWITVPEVKEIYEDAVVIPFTEYVGIAGAIFAVLFTAYTFFSKKKKVDNA
ncbi:MAG: hypothetical protein ACI4OA_01305 [Selenomonadaceae bacterium]